MGVFELLFRGVTVEKSIEFHTNIYVYSAGGSWATEQEIVISATTISNFPEHCEGWQRWPLVECKINGRFKHYWDDELSIPTW